MVTKSKFPRGKNPNSLANLRHDNGFKPGVSGNPAGRPPSGPLFSPALRRFAQMKAEDILRLPDEYLATLTAVEVVALRVICEAMQTGNVPLLMEFVNRLDGKSREQVELEVKGTVTVVRKVPRLGVGEGVKDA